MSTYSRAPKIASAYQAQDAPLRAYLGGAKSTTLTSLSTKRWNVLMVLAKEMANRGHAMTPVEVRGVIIRALTNAGG
jgi:hypothetical protein